MADTETHEVIRYTVDMVVVTQEGSLRRVLRRFDARRVLLIERGWDPYEGYWALTGGHVDVGEASLDAAVRELFEETGVRVDPASLRQIGTWDAPGRDPRGRYVTVAYRAVIPAGASVTAGDDARRAAWWPLDNLPQNIAFDHADIIGAAVASAS